MAKKIIINETQFQKLLKEEMGIANEVINLTQQIEKTIFQHDYQDFTEKIKTEKSEVGLDVVYREFNTSDEYYDWLRQTKRFDGYSKEQNTIFLNIIRTDGQYNIHNLFDTIQHEVEHYWQCNNAGKGFYGDKYNVIIKGVSSDDVVLSSLCKILYCCNKLEIMAFVNGTYNSATHKNKTYLSLSEFIVDNQINDIYTVLKNADKKLDKYRNSYVFSAVYYLRKNHLVPDVYTNEEIFNYIKNEAIKAYNYLIKKISRCYSLYISRQKLEEKRYIEGKIRLLKDLE